MSPRSYRSIDDVFADDDEGLLDTALANPAPTGDQRLVEKFEEISTFVDVHGRPPSAKGPTSEKALARRLASLRARAGNVRTSIEAHDRHHLLDAGAAVFEEHGAEPAGESAPPPSEEVTSLDDILADDDGLLDVANPELYEARHVSFETGKERDTPDEIAQREPCEDFWRFETLFRDIQQEIDDGRSYTQRFEKNAQIDVGDFFILDGVMCLVDAIAQPDQAKEGRYNPRLRVVFSNATEANLLLRSLERALQKDRHSRRIILDPDRALERMQGITHHDHRSGTIYILRSLRDDPELTGVGELYKIGYTEERVDQRIAGAERSPTYLEAPVELVATYTCYNADPFTIERLIHAVLQPLKLNVTLRDKHGKRYRPREWFAVPLSTAKAVVERIADGTIAHYRLDTITAQLVEKRRKYPQNER